MDIKKITEPVLQFRDPEEARRFFETKLAFTTGPVELKEFIDDGLPLNIVDVRSAKDFREGHIPGAVSLPEDRWQTLQGLDQERRNVLVCYSVVCHLAARAAVYFARKGFSVAEMNGGMASWREHGLPVEAGESPKMIA